RGFGPYYRRARGDSPKMKLTCQPKLAGYASSHGLPAEARRAREVNRLASRSSPDDQRERRLAEAPGSRTQPPRANGGRPILKTGRAAGPRSLPGKLYGGLRSADWGAGCGMCSYKSAIQNPQSEKKISLRSDERRP